MEKKKLSAYFNEERAVVIMTLFETVGNIKVFTENYPDGSIEVSFFNGSDLVARETYFNATTEGAISDLFSKKLDTYTEEYLWLNCLTDGLEKLTDNTYKVGSMDWFCRIDNTRYFKHFHKSENDFVIDKNGEKIIDR